ncbi:unnamed protein product [Rotaria sordida]|nr:unnamed protein product [Rotaria sordida]CAF0967790.1 unnamed protein product [Rotaria sordida]CAF1004922.1 unnamed protein product [Rotaria sordida]CAF3563160.1 unnamed protein product [Rotaria sordida]CAF3676353.1 unnamed protein product [Rotaria sordida]
MTVNNTTNDNPRNPSHFQSGGKKLHRVASLTCQGLTAITSECLISKTTSNVTAYLRNGSPQALSIYLKIRNKRL